MGMCDVIQCMYVVHVLCKYVCRAKWRVTHTVRFDLDHVWTALWPEAGDCQQYHYQSPD